MKLSNKLIIPTIALTLITGVTIGTVINTQAFAQSSESSTKFSTVIQKLVDKFSLNTTEVQATIDEAQQERQTEKEARYEESLTEAVTNGELTEEQKQLILDKHKQLAAESQQRQNELQEWADTNGVDVKYLKSTGMHGHGMGRGVHEADQ